MWATKIRDHLNKRIYGSPKIHDSGRQPLPPPPECKRPKAPVAPPVRRVCDSDIAQSSPPNQPPSVEYRNKPVHYNDPYCSYLPPLGAKVVILLQGVELTVTRTEEPVRKKYEDDLVYELRGGGFITGRFKWRHV